MAMRFAVLLALALAACGDDGYDPNACKPAGIADVDGTIKDEPIGPFVRAEQVMTSDAAGSTYAIALDEAEGACGEVAPTGKHLVFLLCSEPAAGTYVIASEQIYHCPINGVLAIVEKDGGADFATATAGTLTIAHAGGCLDGTYTATFGLDDLTGTFDAIVCP